MAEQRAYVHLVDGEVLAVYLIPEGQATPELAEQISGLARFYSQPIANIIPYSCETGPELLDCIREQNPEEEAS